MKTESVQYCLSYGSRQIAFSVIRSQRRSLGIEVLPDLTVEVRAPKRAPEYSIREFVAKKAPWIARKLAEFEQCHPLPSLQNFLSGETLFYLGRQYLLKVESGCRKSAELIGRYLWVQVEDETDTAQVKRAVEAWYRGQAQETFGRYLDKCLLIAARHDLPRPQFTIRDMRTRWGSCSPRGRVSLNLKLVQVPLDCIEYVIMHELCHMKHHNHSKAFYSLLSRCQPDWQEREKVLNQFRLT
jgi:predicted metal-dependent hydrolase